MSIPNRTVSITGVFAADASTTIPSAPVSGVAYRNTAMTGTVIREGWAYKTIVDSANFNQALYEYSSVTAQVEKYGLLPWSNLTDYVKGSVCLGSNGMLYQAKQATGPSTTALDPTTDSLNTYWEDFVGKTYVKKAGSNTIPANNTFSGNNTFEKTIISTATTPICTKRSDYTMGVAPSSTKDNTIGFQDSTNAFAGYFKCEYNADGSNYVRIVARNKNNGSIVSAGIDMWANIDGTTGITASGSVKRGIVDWGTPNYSTRIDCNGYTSQNNQFTAPSAGVIYGATQGNATLYINDVVVKTLNTLGYPGYPFFYVLSKGDRFYGTTLTDCHFSPMKGV